MTEEYRDAHRLEAVVVPPERRELVMGRLVLRWVCVRSLDVARRRLLRVAAVVPVTPAATVVPAALLETVVVMGCQALELSSRPRRLIPLPLA